MKIDARETLRLALIYAIQDRRDYLDSYRNVEGEEGNRVRAETRAEIEAFKKMLKRRYGEQHPADEAAKNAAIWWLSSEKPND